MQKHIKITFDEDDEDRFVLIKKILSILMIITFIIAGVYSLYGNIFLDLEIH